MIEMTQFFSFQIHSGGFGGGVAANVASFLEFIEGLSGKSPNEVFTTIYPGIALMENIHPLFVHFPIALFTTFFLVDFIGSVAKKPQWRYVASWLLYMGTVAAALAVVAGFIAADTVEHDDVVHEIMERHEHFGLSVLSLALFLSAWRVKHWGLNTISGNSLFLGLSALLCLLLSLGADLGGLMVYQYGVSVKPSAIVPEASVTEPTQPNPAAVIAPNQPSTQENGGQAQGNHEHGGHNHNGHDHGGHHHHHTH